MQQHHYGPHPAQFGELSLPVARTLAGVVVIIHGGFWRGAYDLELGRPLAIDLAARGVAVWNLEYRQVSTGGGWPATFADVAAGIDLLAELAVDVAPVVLVGHSAGGHLAVWAAGRDRLPAGAPGAEPRVRAAGVIAQAGVLDLTGAARDRIGGTAVPDLMGGDPDEMAEQYRLADASSMIPLGVPVVCVHAPADDEVPFAQSERYVAKTTAAGGQARLVEAAGDHYTLVDPASRDWRLTVGEIVALLSA